MGNYTEEQTPKIYKNEKFPQKLGPIFFTQCKEVSADPSKAKCMGGLKDTWAERKITRLHHLQHHFTPKSLFLCASS